MTAPAYAMMKLKFSRRVKVDNQKENIADIMKDLSDRDKARLFQCIMCAEDPDTCNCSEKDEDENGLCLKHKPVIIV